MKQISLSLSISDLENFATEINEIIERFGARYVKFAQSSVLTTLTLKFSDDLNCAYFLDEFENKGYGREIA